MHKTLLAGTAFAAILVGSPAFAELKFAPGEDSRFPLHGGTAEMVNTGCLRSDRITKDTSPRRSRSQGMGAWR